MRPTERAIHAARACHWNRAKVDDATVLCIICAAQIVNDATGPLLAALREIATRIPDNSAHFQVMKERNEECTCLICVARRAVAAWEAA